MPKIVDHQQRRTEIVFALWAVIYQRGIDGVTLQHVATEAGISVGRIQHYFASKQELVREGARAMIEDSARHFAQAQSPDPGEALRQLLLQPIPATDGFRLGSAVWYAYLAKSVSDPEIAAIVNEAVAGSIGEVARLVRLDVADPPLADPEATATRLVAVSNGLAQAVLVGAITPERARLLVEQQLRSIEAWTSHLPMP